MQSDNNSKKLLLKIENISIKWKDSGLPLVKDLNMQVREGDIIAIMGKSGIGKSMLLDVLIQDRLYESIQVDGAIHYPLKRTLKAVVPQSTTLFPWLNLIDNVVIGLDSSDIPDHQKYIRASKIMRKLDLSGFENALPKESSGGMRQRAAIARALVSEPHILFMDEPFSALDPVITHDIWEDLIDLDIAIIMVNHDIEQTALYADRVIIMKHEYTKVHKIDISRPRYNFAKALDATIDNIYSEIAFSDSSEPKSVFGPLQDCSLKVETVMGLLLDINVLSERKDKFDLSNLSNYAKSQDSHDVIEAVSLLRSFGLVITDKEGNVDISSLGCNLVENDDKRSYILSSLLMKHVPVIRIISDYHKENNTEAMSLLQLSKILIRQHKTDRRRVFQLINRVIEWGRYSEMIGYDDYTQQLYVNEAST